MTIKAEKKIELKVMAGSVIGGRKQNQDNFLLDAVIKNVDYINKDYCCEGLLKVDERKFFFVCDGMGGREDGQKASKMAIEFFYKRLPYMKKCTPVDIVKLIIEINLKIANYYKSVSKKGGTTLSILQINPNQSMEIYNIGDSPVLLIRNNKLKMISEEQSVAGMKLKGGMISEREYKNSREKNILLGFLGDTSMKSVQNLYYSGKIPYYIGDKIIVSSDGLPGSIQKEKILEMTNKGADAKMLLEEGKKKKDSDNITVIMIKVK